MADDISPVLAAIVVLLVAVLGLALVPAAQAATVRVDYVCTNPSGKGPEVCESVMSFAAAPGEANVVSAAAPAAGRVVIRDAGAALTAQIGCTQIDSASASCLNAAGSAALGDGDDRLTIPPTLVLRVSGDAGDDVITAAGLVRGGDGDDVIAGSDLDGGAGNDRLTGTTGSDRLFGDRGDDTIDGGPGIDTVEYGVLPSFGWPVVRTDAPLAVTVDLADPAPDGAAGERDVLSAVENVTASAADGDVLRGDDGPNVLEGVGGRDVLVGRGGDDRLEAGGELDGGAGDDVLSGDFAVDTLRGGPGDDRLAGDAGADIMEGGSGDDRLDASERVGTRTYDADELRCGSGRDRVSEPDIVDRAGACERIAVGGGFVVDSSTLVKLPGPRVQVTVRCARSGRRCLSDMASAAASGTAFNPRLRVRLAPGARRRLVLDRFHPGGRARLRRSRVIAFGNADHGFAVRVKR